MTERTHRLLTQVRLQHFEDACATHEKEGGVLEMVVKVYRRADGALAAEWAYGTDSAQQLRAMLAEVIHDVREPGAAPPVAR